MKFSIITVTYNSVNTLQKTINSVRNQSVEKEYIIVDGGSCDGTLDIVQQNTDVVDRLITDKDDGIYDAMNIGISESSGDIVGIINSDDWYESRTLDKVRHVFAQDKRIDIVHGSMRVWREDGTVHAVYGNKKESGGLLRAPFSHPTCFVRQRIYQRLGTFDTQFPRAADYDFMLRALDNEVSDKYLPEVIANFRFGGETGGEYLSGYKEVWGVLRKNNYNVLECTIALFARLSRDLLAKLINTAGLHRLRKKVRELLSYHVK